jgi:hypothetical protein
MAAATKTKPAKPARKPGIGVKDVAEHLGTTPLELRKFIRTLDLGVGRGSRYSWSSMSDSTVKRIVAEWENKAAE